MALKEIFEKSDVIKFYRRLTGKREKELKNEIISLEEQLKKCGEIEKENKLKIGYLEATLEKEKEKVIRELKEANKVIEVYSQDGEKLQREIENIRERLSDNYDPFQDLLKKYNKSKIELILSTLEIPISRLTPSQKICKCSIEHHAPKGYFDFIKKLSRNKYVEQIMYAKGQSVKGEKIKILDIFKDCIHVIYSENNFGLLLNVKTTSEDEFANRIIGEILRR